MKYACLLAVVFAAVLSAALLTGGQPAETAFPGSNGQIVFRSDRTGDDEIWAMGADGSNQTNLTNTDGFDHDPQWSPDGTKVAYFSCREDQSCEIYVMNADGSGQTRITNSPEDDYDPAWSPDGTKIAISQEVDPEIYVMNANGSNLTNITNNPAFDGDPAWSPDGTKIAFTSTRDGNAEVYTIDVSGANPTNLTNLPSSGENNAAWSPDGSMIAYTSQDDGDIWVMNADGSNKRRLTTDSAWDDDAAWSPDGTMIAFTSERDDDDGDVHVIPFTGVSSAGGGDGAVNITNSAGFDGVPDWGPAPEPTPSPTPSPSPTPAPGLAGDADCREVVDSVDALHDLRFVAGIQPAAACIDDGNVKCDDALTAVDSLFILRYVAQLPVSLPQGCPAIGT